jgi:hypothetical protein
MGAPGREKGAVITLANTESGLTVLRYGRHA